MCSYVPWPTPESDEIVVSLEMGSELVSLQAIDLALPQEMVSCVNLFKVS